MPKRELFIKRVYEIVNELKIPLIDERVYDKVGFSTSSAIAKVTFKFEEDERFRISILTCERKIK
ncbi:MAG: hypothetical protein P8Y23_17775 [Candidatus Lokiarchaeota archaeon]